MKNIEDDQAEEKNNYSMIEKKKELSFKRVEFWQGRAVYCKKTNSIKFILFDFKNRFLEQELVNNGFQNHSKNKNVWSKEFNEETIQIANYILQEVEELFEIAVNSNINKVRYNNLIEWFSKNDIRYKNNISDELIYKIKVIEIYEDFFPDFYKYATNRLVGYNLENRNSTKLKCNFIREDGSIEDLKESTLKILKLNGMNEEAEEMNSKLEALENHKEMLDIIKKYVDITNKIEVYEEEFE